MTCQRYAANGAVLPPRSKSVRDHGTVQLTASRELDFFGKNRAALDAALGNAPAAEANAQATRVLLASHKHKIGSLRRYRMREQLSI